MRYNQGEYREFVIFYTGGERKKNIWKKNISYKGDKNITNKQIFRWQIGSLLWKPYRLSLLTPCRGHHLVTLSLTSSPATTMLLSYFTTLLSLPWLPLYYNRVNLDYIIFYLYSFYDLHIQNRFQSHSVC